MHNDQSNWAELSSELWVTIFLCSSRTTKRAKSGPTMLVNELPARANAKASHSLPMVCQKFKDIFDQTPFLSSTLWLDSNFIEFHLEAMIKWTHKHNAIQELVARTKSPWLEVALGSLLTSSILADVPTVLTQACLVDIGRDTPRLLGQFCKLTTLELGTTSMDKQVHLHGLQQLPLLTNLMLCNGTFANLHTLSYLTSLQVLDSEIHCDDDCKFTSSLKSLLVETSCLHRFYTRGLSACSSLQSLQLESATIEAVNNVDTLTISDMAQSTVPHSLSALDALTALSCYIDNPHLSVRLTWLGHLTYLQDLHLVVSSQQLDFPEDISSLKNLTKLYIYAHAQIKFDFIWAELIALAELGICGMFQVSYNLVDIALIKALKHVKMARPEGSCHSTVQQISRVSTVQQIGRLAHALGATRPDVLFELL